MTVPGLDETPLEFWGWLVALENAGVMCSAKIIRKVPAPVLSPEFSHKNL